MAGSLREGEAGEEKEREGEKSVVSDSGNTCARAGPGGGRLHKHV